MASVDITAYFEQAVRDHLNKGPRMRERILVKYTSGRSEVIDYDTRFTEGGIMYFQSDSGGVLTEIPLTSIESLGPVLMPRNRLYATRVIT